MGRSFLRRWFSQSLKDIEAGDAVRIVGYRGVAFVVSVNNEMALVVWAKDRRDIVPIVSLRRVKAGGSSLDRRGPLT